MKMFNPSKHESIVINDQEKCISNCDWQPRTLPSAGPPVSAYIYMSCSQSTSQEFNSSPQSKMNLILFPLLCLVLASQAQKLCVPAEDQMAICHKDNALGKKADGAMKSCAAQLGMERSLGKTS